MRRTAAVVVLLIAAPWVRPAPPERTHAVTVDDYFSIATPTEVAIAPDGKRVAYAEARWQASSNDRKADLWVAEDDGTVRRLTFDRGNDHSLRWAPDGRTIYFLGSRKREGEKKPPYDGKPQVWRIGADGRDLTPVTQVEGGVQGYDLAGDGKSLVYQTETEVLDEGEWKKLREQFRSLEYGHGVRKASQLTRLDLVNWRTGPAYDGGRNVREFKLSPDGKRVAMITAPDETVVAFEGRSRVDVLDLETRKVATVPDKVFRADAPSPWAWLETLAWSADGKRLAFTAIFDAYPAEVVVATLEEAQPASAALVKRPEGLSVRGYGTPLAWAGKALCFLGEEKGRVRLSSARFGTDADGTLTPGDVVVAGFSFTPDGKRFALILNDTTHLPDLYLLAGAGSPRRLTNLNPQVDTWKLPQISVFTWKGANGATVEGILELPPDHKPGAKLPLVVALHGGPTTAVYNHLAYDWSLGRIALPAKGYAVLCPNYRGSTGYGDRFLTDLVGKENDVDVEDILKGVDALVEKGIADPERLGVMGWSNGGYLTNCCIAKTTRFKAANSGAGILDTVMEWGANDEPAYPAVFKKGHPWQVPENYRKTSPTYQLDKIRTPTLIHVGANDERCPPAQSRMLYRALKEYLNVPAELVVYPGEAHSPSQYKHRKAKLAWDLAWFDRYLAVKGPGG